ncbi:MAG: tRNA-(ms[2]io[6]A)-hydroxylase [Cellvibrionales bacterium]|nr:tRNA-(ms[2]io[6]A)-hydroxylase [Cellvibrionales bacterium]
MIDCQPVLDFLGCETPDSWLDIALQNIPTLLINHCYLEQCAARNALTMINRYPEKTDLLIKMSKLAREELIHFERVLKVLKNRGIEYKAHKPSRYAGILQADMRKNEPDKFVDAMIVGAFIEARSCERFYRLAPKLASELLDEALAKFYTSLLQSEARHFEDYLNLAQTYAKTDISDRVEHFRQIEKDAILSPDPLFRFHSGIPEASLIPSETAA